MADTEVPDVLCGPPPKKWTRGQALRLKVAEIFFLERSAANLRWTRRNAQESFLCTCGAPATNWRRDGWPHRYDVRPILGRCNEHRDVPTSAGWSWNGSCWTVMEES